MLNYVKQCSHEYRILIGIYTVGKSRSYGTRYGGVPNQAIFLVCYSTWWQTVTCSIDVMACWRLLHAFLPTVTLSIQLFLCSFWVIPLSSSQPLLSFHPYISHIHDVPNIVNNLCCFILRRMVDLTSLIWSDHNLCRSISCDMVDRTSLIWNVSICEWAWESLIYAKYTCLYYGIYLVFWTCYSQSVRLLPSL